MGRKSWFRTVLYNWNLTEDEFPKPETNGQFLKFFGFTLTGKIKGIDSKMKTLDMRGFNFP